MTKYQVLCFLMIAFSSISWIQAKISHEAIKKLVDDCNVNAADYEIIKKFGVPDTDTGKCAMLCMLKGVKTLDANGKFDYAGAKAGLDEHWTELDPAYRSSIVETCGKRAEPYAQEAGTCLYGYHAAKCINEKVAEKIPGLTIA